MPCHGLLKWRDRAANPCERTLNLTSSSPCRWVEAEDLRENRSFLCTFPGFLLSVRNCEANVTFLAQEVGGTGRENNTQFGFFFF